MIAAFLPLLAAAAAQPEQPPYPAEAVLAAFATACSTAEDFAVARAGLLAGGWTLVPEDDSNPMGKLMKFGRTMAAAMENNKELPDGGSFSKQVEGRTLYVALSGVETRGIISQACRLYDFAATKPLSAETLKDWAVREPGETKEPAEGIIENTWTPGLKPGHMEMKILYIPQDSKIGTSLGVTGLSMGASVMNFTGNDRDTD